MTSHLLVSPARRPLAGVLGVPGDKSIGHRAVLFAGLAQGPSHLAGLSDGQDNSRTVSALRALGIAVEPGNPGELIIHGNGLHGLRRPAAPIDCGNSGTTMRLLCGLLAAQPFPSELDGDVYLRRRPMRRVAAPLRLMGAGVSGAPTGDEQTGELYPPLRITPAASLRGIRYQSPIASAQVKSAILLCGLYAEGPTEVNEAQRSRDHTERMLAGMGAPLWVSPADQDPLAGARCRLDPTGWNRQLAPLRIEVPGDLSSAAFLLGAALLAPGGEVTVRNVGLNPTRTGVLDAFAQLCPGAVTVHDERLVAGEPVGDLHVRAPAGTALRPLSIDEALAVRALDELPLLAALAGAAEGDTVIRGAAELRVKESDRIAASCALLRAFGVACEELPDGLVVHGRGPGGLTPGRVDSFGDHRIAMAAAVLALAVPGGADPVPVRIDDTGNVATSYPGFVAALRALGAELKD